MTYDPTSLREVHERFLGTTLEGLWGFPVGLTSPDGEVQTPWTTADKTGLSGQVLFNRVEVELDTSNLEQTTMVSKPVVTLRISSLTRVPQPGERWIVKCPRIPSRSAPLVTHLAIRGPTGGDSIGFMTMHCDRLVQE